MTTAFEILGEMRDVETIAVGRGVYIRHYLERTYGRGRWRKTKGIAMVQLVDGTICEPSSTGLKRTASVGRISKSSR